jgi:transketolase
MLGFAAGLASAGFIPFASTFSAFASLQSLDVIRNDHAYTSMPVRTIGTHTGISMGYFASSHHAIEDIGALQSIPNLMVISPADLNATEALIKATMEHPGPVYFRLGRGADGPPVYESAPELVVGSPQVLVEGSDVLVVATGITVHAARDAALSLAAAGTASVSVVDVHTIKPFDDDAIAELASRHRAVVVVEDHMVDGGLGTSVLTALADAAVSVPVYRHGLRDFAIIGPPSQMYTYYGLDAAGIATVIVRALERDDSAPAGRTRQPLWTDADRLDVLTKQVSADEERFREVFER